MRDVQGSIEGASGEWVWRDGDREREEGIEERLEGREEWSELDGCRYGH